MNSYNSAFELLTDCPIELGRLETLSKAMNLLVDTVSFHEWTATEAAKQLNIDVDVVESCLNGRISQITLEQLRCDLSQSVTPSSKKLS